MSKEEIESLLKSILWPLSIRARDGLWIKAFRIYNESNEKKLSTSCGICYKKVLDYHKSKLNESVQ
jgi:hypothetical protein